MKLLEADALVLAGGLGTRLRGALPTGVPKIMAPVQGKPFARVLFRMLYEQGVRRIVVSLGYGAEHVIRFIQSHPWPVDLALEYVVEQAPLGTGGAIAFASSRVRTDPFVALNGDTISDVNIGALLAFHERRHAAITLALICSAETERFGHVLTAQDGRVIAFSEKAATGGPSLVNCGLYAISRGVLGDLPIGRPLSWEKDVLARYVDRGLFGLELATQFLDIGIPESLAQAAFLAGVVEGK